MVKVQFKDFWLHERILFGTISIRKNPQLKDSTVRKTFSSSLNGTTTESLEGSKFSKHIGCLN